MHNFKAITSAMALTLIAGAASAEGWTLDPSMSNVSFGSIKNEYVGESHSFTDISGAVATDGTVTVDIALGSVETLIDIRNERMIEHVFAASPSATVTAQIDMAAMDGLAVGDGIAFETEGTLSLLGNDVSLPANLYAIRMAEDRVIVTTTGMVMLATDEAGIDAGINVLQELAGLDGISRVSPVTMRLVFGKEG